MKRKINFKLTFILVSLFIGFLLIVLGNKNKYCLSFGFIALAVALIIYVVDKFQSINKKIIEIDIQIDETNVEDVDTIMALSEYKQNLKKQKNFACIMSFCFAVLLIVVALVNLF